MRMSMTISRPQKGDGEERMGNQKEPPLFDDVNKNGNYDSKGLNRRQW